MTNIPFGWDDPLLMGAFMACAVSTATLTSAVDSFQKDTELNLGAFVSRAPIERMVDQATGADRGVFVAWLDWVAEHVWGLDGAEEPEDQITP